VPSLDHVTSLFDYNAWANGHILDASAKLSDGDLLKELGASFGSVRGNLVHVLWAQSVWLSRFQAHGGPVVLGDFASLATIRDAYTESHDALGDYVGSLSEDDLATELSYTDTRGNAFVPPLWQLLVHMVNHGTHHRAECAMLLTSLESPPRQLDFIFFELERAGAPPRLT
jgi:uncharacterized damage-inducible protein DinB